MGLYRIVPVNEAHVRILFNKKDVFSSRASYEPAYWIIPFVTKVVRLPLVNLRIDVPDIKLNDINMAKFSCDIVCFVNITNPLLAAERTTITAEKVYYEQRSTGEEKIAADFRAIMESVGRTVATKQTILEVYMDRSKLDIAVTNEVEPVFPKWGLTLVDLEIKDLKDVADCDPPSTIIKDIEAKQAAQINADMRVKVAQEDKRATVIEAQMKKEGQFEVYKQEEEWRKRQIEKERTLAIAQQEREQAEAKQMMDANAQKVEAERKKTVGMAGVEKERIIQLATAEKERLTLEADGQAAQILKLKLADAEGTNKLAMALQNYNDAAIGIEVVRANKDIGLALADAYKSGLAKANINIVSGESANLVDGGLLGKIRLGGKEGVAIQQFLQTLPGKQREQFEKAVDKLIGARVKEETPVDVEATVKDVDGG